MDTKMKKPLKIKFIPPKKPTINPKPPCPTDEEKRNATISKLSDIVFHKVSKDYWKPVKPELRSQIQQCLHGFYNALHTPTHPPYSLMIQNALEDLNEEDGSSEEAISEFIRRHYRNLAWAHSGLLSHHLEKLIRDGEVICTRKGRYVAASSSTKQNQKIMRIESDDEYMIKPNEKQSET